MANTVTGIIKAISNMETLTSHSGKSYTKQSVLLDCGFFSPMTGEKYDNDLLLDFINLRDGDIKSLYVVGTRVEVSFTLRGFTYQDKDDKKRWGVNISCYKMQLPADPRGRAAVAPQTAPQATPIPPVVPPTDDECDLPF